MLKYELSREEFNYLIMMKRAYIHRPVFCQIMSKNDTLPELTYDWAEYDIYTDNSLPFAYLKIKSEMPPMTLIHIMDP